MIFLIEQILKSITLNCVRNRVLIELNRREDAKELIQTVNSKDLKNQVSLLKQAEKEIIKRKEPSQRGKEHQPEPKKLVFGFQRDEHLETNAAGFGSIR